MKSPRHTVFLAVGAIVISRADEQPRFYARRWCLPRVVDRLLVPATQEPHISCNLRGSAEFQEGEVGGD